MTNQTQEIASAPGIVQGPIRNPAEATPCEGSDASPQPAVEQDDDIDEFEDLYERWLDGMVERR